jgi:hypothetical protein
MIISILFILILDFSYRWFVEDSSLLYVFVTFEFIFSMILSFTNFQIKDSLFIFDVQHLINTF